MTASPDAAGSGPAYRVVEVVDVTDHALEAALNRTAGEGYRFESIHFVTQHGSRRPAMAFLFFTRGGASARE
ncbi:MAG: DUF4177 domain-containing protein [Deltaproteobacteria bacterium]|nr:DUF4177 domain-containing protein [Deltaproteobacteria bacterium]PWB63627.1 MAG: DUF4177 domain-containing protein [Deltaproteobacteria bacterium]